MCKPPTDGELLDDVQYLSAVLQRIERKARTIRGRFAAGDVRNAAALLMTIHDDTADIAAAWNRQAPER